MNPGYYKIPLNVNSLMNFVDLPKSNLHDSIMQYLQLLIVTKFGELDSDTNFGCKIWEDDFCLSTNHLNYIEEMKDHLQKVIKQYEKRLSDVKMNILISQEVTGDSSGNTDKRIKSNIRTRLDIKVNGIITKTNSAFNTVYSMYINPYSSL